MKLHRRTFMRGAALAGFGAAADLSTDQALSKDVQLVQSQLRGAIDARQSGLRPGAIDDQSKLFQDILNQADAADKPVFLPPGNYLVSNLVLPPRTRITGVPGASKLIYTGGGHFLLSEDAHHLEITGVVIDGANRTLAEYSPASMQVSRAKHVVIDNCLFVGSSKTSLQIERSSGRVERNRISGAAGECALYAVENKGMQISSNVVEDCLNGGILVHRWEAGDDGTIVTNNRVSRINNINGGTGQWGNGINVFRANNVIVSNNHVSDCTLSAIRSNAGSNVQISNNTCLRSGETAVYSEFEFQGAVISNNVIDGGARGISITNFQQGGRIAVVSGNLIRNITNKPPYTDDDFLWGEGISAEAETVISNNVIERAKFAMMLGWGPYMRNLIANNNIIRDADLGIYVSVVDGVGPVKITQNVFSKIDKEAVAGFEWKKQVTGELVSNSGSYANLDITQNTVG